MESIQPLVFFALAGLAIASAALIAFSRNLVYSAFALLGAFSGVAGLFVLLGADFLAIIQVLVYVGGVLVLYLFAVLMSAGISDVKLSNPISNYKVAVPALILMILLLAKLIYGTDWHVSPELLSQQPTTASIGEAFLNEYLLPFELISILLLATLVGAVANARKEVQLNKKEVGHD